MSTYPGNASLATAVKDRVLSTFDQTLALYQQGRTEEVVAGCNLILQMDPLFDPARKLLDKARDPNAHGNASGLTGGGGDRLAEARQAMAARDFERVVQITTDILTNDLMNDEARVLSDEAREKIEAAPFVEQFVRKCQQHVSSGNIAAARTDLEKARALDPSHPGLAQVEDLIRKSESAAAPAAFDASSFVVDTPATPRGTTQASDFGFTFEEEKNAGGGTGFDSFSFNAPAPAAAPKPQTDSGSFSFDTPVEGMPAFNFEGPAPVKEGSDFDFSTASMDTSPDDQKKIEQYLADGDRAFAAGDNQQAIDLWSRIFLIDVTNEAASERIEKAKIRRREIEQQMESVLVAGIQAFDRKDFPAALAKFEEVLRNDPGNVQATDYMERLSGPAVGVPAFQPPAPSSGDVFDEPEAQESDFQAPPPSGMREIPLPRKPASAPAASAKKPPLMTIAIVVGVIALAVAGWFVMSRMGGDSDEATGGSQALVTRATSLGQQGKFDEAIATLQEIKPGDAQYDSALAMIADLQQKKARAATTVDGRPPTAYFDENIAAGRAAFASHDYAAAKRGFENAMRVKPLPPDVKMAYDTASQQVAKLATAQSLFAERRYAEVISSLEPLRAQDPQNSNIRRMIVDAHFNLGTIALRQDRLPDAIKAFDEVLREDPNDDLARRSKELAERYEGQPRDLLYRIYVKYLPLRQPSV